MDLMNNLQWWPKFLMILSTNLWCRTKDKKSFVQIREADVVIILHNSSQNLIPGLIKWQEQEVAAYIDFLIGFVETELF